MQVHTVPATASQNANPTSQLGPSINAREFPLQYWSVITLQSNFKWDYWTKWKTFVTYFDPHPAGYATSPRVKSNPEKDWIEPQRVKTEQQMHRRQHRVKRANTSKTWKWKSHAKTKQWQLLIYQWWPWEQDQVRSKWLHLARREDTFDHPSR